MRAYRFVFKSKEKAALNFKENYRAEFVKTDESFYTFLTFKYPCELEKLQKEFKEAQFLPKP